MSSLSLYRSRILDHASIADGTIEDYLSEAATLHPNATVWGNAYALAMVYYAAHQIERTPGLGSGTADDVGGIASKSDGDLSVSYGGAAATGDPDDGLQTTRYGQRYLQLRASRAAGRPRALRVF